ncbi:MAG: hypothetical protein JWO05_883 [Gemmatimonadetes bacterium]|nr:hypothetical protein [Gemmatimonadota bacterium]
MSELTGAHLHLLVNHVPIIGAFFALALLVASYFWSPDVLRRTACAVLIATALSAWASDLSGDSAAGALRGMPGVRRDDIRAHEQVAGTALLVGGLLGVLALAALVRWRRNPIPARAAHAMTLATVVVGALMAYVGLLGGRIRHTEVRPGAGITDAMTVEPPRTRAR